MQGRTVTRRVLISVSSIAKPYVAKKLHPKAKRLLKLASLSVLKRILYTFQRRQDLVIIDDIFPNPLSAFRLNEFNYYLDQIKRVEIYCTCTAFRWIGDSRSFKDVKNIYSVNFPEHEAKIFEYNRLPFKSKLVYFVFLNNTFNHLDVIETLKIPFVFTLYPGGGFQLNNREVDEKLGRVFTSPFFRHVIVTSNTTLKYLLDKKFCPEEKIRFIYGFVAPTDFYLSNKTAESKKFGFGKLTLDICFVAHKYQKAGIDKGYDTFIAVAYKLVEQVCNVRFHVVGNFDETDIDISQISNHITFYGKLSTSEFVEFYRTMDIILSPNKSFKLSLGGFDGFPTGSCIEAGLNEVALFVSDDLNQNSHFNNKEDIVLITTDPLQIVEEILYFYEHPHELRRLAVKGKEKIARLYSTEVQLKQRLELLEEYIK